MKQEHKVAKAYENLTKEGDILLMITSDKPNLNAIKEFTKS